jgi:hypothetical protein
MCFIILFIRYGVPNTLGPGGLKRDGGLDLIKPENHDSCRGSPDKQTNL